MNAIRIGLCGLIAGCRNRNDFAICCWWCGHCRLVRLPRRRCWYCICRSYGHEISLQRQLRGHFTRFLFFQFIFRIQTGERERWFRSAHLFRSNVFVMLELNSILFPKLRNASLWSLTRVSPEKYLKMRKRRKIKLTHFSQFFILGYSFSIHRSTAQHYLEFNVFFCIFSRDHFRVSYRRVLPWFLSSSIGKKVRTEIHKMLPWRAVSHCQGYGHSVSRVICFFLSSFPKPLSLAAAYSSIERMFSRNTLARVPFTWVSCFLDHRFNG